MRRRLALIAEIFGRADNARAEESGPLPIHRHAADERIRRTGQPASIAQPVVRNIRWQRWKDRKQFRLHRVLGLQELAPMMHKRWPPVGSRPLVHHERGWKRRERIAKLLDLVALGRQLRRAKDK